jgi:hypothetical protein
MRNYGLQAAHKDGLIGYTYQITYIRLEKVL